MNAFTAVAMLTLATSALCAKQGATPRCQVSPPPTQSPATVPQPDPLDSIMPRDQQKELGWDKLTASERVATAVYLKEQRRSASAIRTRLDAEDAADRVDAEQTGWSSISAREHLERDGWKQLPCEIISVGGENFFVVSQRFRSYKTSDIPFQLNQIRMRSARPNGKFWCREARLLGGISEILVGGDQHRFQFTEWSEVD